MIYEAQNIGTNNHFVYEYREGFSFPLHLHRCFEFLAVTEGEFEVTIDEINYIVTEGNCALIFPHQSHSYNKKGESRIVLGIFSPDLVPHFFNSAKGKLPENPIFSVNTLIFEDKLSNIYKKKALLYYLCGCLAEQTTLIDKRAKTGEERLLDRIFIEVEANLHNDCKLQDIAIRTNYEYSYLSKYFRRKTGMSFTEYLNLCRISLACQILRNEECKIADVAIRSGYSTLRSFNDNFIKFTGITPSEYKTQRIMPNL